MIKGIPLETEKGERSSCWEVRLIHGNDQAQIVQQIEDKVSKLMASD